MQNIPENIIERVKKLLKLSESPNEAEAALALAKAQEYALEFDLDLACVAISEQKKEEFVKEDINLNAKRKSVTHSDVVYLLNRFFNVKMLQSTGNIRWSGAVIHFIGKKSDVEIAKYIYGYLNHTFMALWHEYRAQNPLINTKARGSYITGLRMGLEKKLQEEKKKKENEKFESVERVLGQQERYSAENKYALICVQKSRELDEAVNTFFPKVGKVSYRSYRNHNSNAFSDGMSKGATISLTRALNGGQKALAY